MKQLYALLISLLTVLSADAQSRGNEWIDYTRKYLKIKVWTDGVYRLDSATLSNALAPTGVFLSSIDPRNLQIFHNGTEEYIWVQGENDGSFDGTDFVEFIGHRNTGAMDAELYGGIDSVLNPYFSLYSDTSVYFLTWNASTNNRRLTYAQDTTFSNYSITNSFLNTEKFVGNTLYLPGLLSPDGLSDPEFLKGEGFYYYDAGYNSPQTFNLNSQYADPAGPPALMRARIGTHSNDYSIGSDNDVRMARRCYRQYLRWIRSGNVFSSRSTFVSWIIHYSIHCTECECLQFGFFRTNGSSVGHTAICASLQHGRTQPVRGKIARSCFAK
jgi:hypothetical protein